MHINTLRRLAAVTVPVTALAVFLPSSQTTLGTAAGSGKLLPDLASKLGNGATLTITSASGKVTLRHTSDTPGQGWVLADKGGYPVDAAKLKPILTGLTDLRGVAPKTARPALYSRLDLNDPGPGSVAHGVALTSATGAPLGSVILGRVKSDFASGGHDEIYARVPGQDQTWLATPSITFPYAALDWIDRGVINLPADDIKQVTVTPKSATQSLPPFTLSRAKPGDKLALQDLPAGAKPKSDTAGTEVANALGGLTLEDVKPASQLSGQPDATLHAATFAGLTVDLTATKQDGKIWITVAASGAKPADDITARTKGWAYEVADGTATSLETKLADLITVPAGKK
jgi:hypothetical protein